MTKFNYSVIAKNKRTANEMTDSRIVKQVYLNRHMRYYLDSRAFVVTVRAVTHYSAKSRNFLNRKRPDLSYGTYWINTLQVHK